jgi:hypothetical protein
LSRTHLAVVFKCFASWIRSSSTGLNVAGHATAKVLREYGIDVSVFPVRHNIDLVHAIDSYNETHKEHLTDVVISAPWLSKFDMEALLKNFKDIRFVVLSHSNVGFLQADVQGVELIRQYIGLQRKYPNLRVGGNSEKFVHWLREAFDPKAVLLPNLYPFTPRPSKRWIGPILKIGAFGAPRPYKNFMTAAAATVVMQRTLGCSVEFHMNQGGEAEGYETDKAIEQLFRGTSIKLIKHSWSYWNEFIKIVGSMDVLMQPSFTESFNMIAADGISRGVSSVVSSAINWAPEDWKADSDNALSVAHIALRLLSSVDWSGSDALMLHNEKSIQHWFRYLGIEKKRESWFTKVKKFLS